MYRNVSRQIHKSVNEHSTDQHIETVEHGTCIIYELCMNTLLTLSRSIYVFTTSKQTTSDNEVRPIKVWTQLSTNIRDWTE